MGANKDLGDLLEPDDIEKKSLDRENNIKKKKGKAAEGGIPKADEESEVPAFTRSLSSSVAIEAGVSIDIAREALSKTGRDGSGRIEAVSMAEKIMQHRETSSFQVPISPMMKKEKVEGHRRISVPDEAATIVDDPCTYKVAKNINTVLVVMQSHQKNVDVQHCAAMLLRWILAWGDPEVGHLMDAAQAGDELLLAKQNHPTHRSLQNHVKFALRRLAELQKAHIEISSSRHNTPRPATLSTT